MAWNMTAERQKAPSQRDEKEIRISRAVSGYKLGLYSLIREAAEVESVAHTTVGHPICGRTSMWVIHDWQQLFTTAAESTTEKWC